MAAACARRRFCSTLLGSRRSATFCRLALPLHDVICNRLAKAPGERQARWMLAALHARSGRTGAPGDALDLIACQS